MKKIYLLATAVIAVSLMGLDAKADCTPPAGTTICAETDLTVQAGHWKFSSESDPLTDGEILSIEAGINGIPFPQHWA